jgi:hypothetical protein
MRVCLPASLARTRLAPCETRSFPLIGSVGNPSNVREACGAGVVPLPITDRRAAPGRGRGSYRERRQTLTERWSATCVAAVRVRDGLEHPC